jgi:hypothetical protein
MSLEDLHSMHACMQTGDPEDPELLDIMKQQGFDYKDTVACCE